ncbi:MAG: hypothetical protein AAFX94_15475 [Myxococcota bacterium]
MRVLFLAAGCLLTASGCSLLLDWDQDGLPCSDTEPQCSEGFSCFFNQECVRDGATPRGEQCSEDRQCAPDLFCRNAVCREPCSQAFYAEFDDCRGDEYCAPFTPTEGPIEGFCVESDCLEDSDCVEAGSVQSCVRIKVSAGACLSSCEFGFDPLYFDTCVVEPGGVEAYCQAIGRDDRDSGAELVCLDAGDALEGQPCNPILNPCQDGFTCDPTGSAAVCARFCSVNDPASCGSGQICCQKEFGEARYSVCATNCN